MDDWEDWSLEELRMWRKELQRIFLSGVATSGTVNGVTMSFRSLDQVERSLAAVRLAIKSKSPVLVTETPAIIQVVTLRPRKGF